MILFMKKLWNKNVDRTLLITLYFLLYNKCIIVINCCIIFGSTYILGMNHLKKGFSPFSPATLNSNHLKKNIMFKKNIILQFYIDNINIRIEQNLLWKTNYRLCFRLKIFAAIFLLVAWNERILKCDIDYTRN